MIRNINIDELKGMMDSGVEFVLVDVLDEKSFDNEHICSSINVPEPQIEQKSKELINRDETVIVYCGGPACSASGRAADKLEKLGYKNVRRFEGGLEEWRRSGFCLEGHAYKEKAA